MEGSFRLEYYNARVREDIEDWSVEAPHSKAMGGGLFELRPKGRSGIGRAFYCFCSGRVITVLHAFVKKTQKTPRRELLIARERLSNVKRHA
jgi:phage-related protein